MTWAFLVDSVPFTREVIAGQTSLGGSESACLGVARALAHRGHQVHVFTTRLDEDCEGLTDHEGVVWHGSAAFTPMNRFVEWDVVVSLRAITCFAGNPIYARYRILWSQDLLVPGDMVKHTMAIAWALDRIAYVSPYHRAQWEEQLPDLASLGWVTRNSYNPDDLPNLDLTMKTRGQVIYISRPERGLGPLLTMWPQLRTAIPWATLKVCRYSSMYDTGPGSWSDVCATWDQELQRVQAETGGIEYLGELNKPDLYRAIAASEVMWYPGLETFAETGCLAAIEAQACGTPIVGSYRGALPGVVQHGHLVRGDTGSDDYQNESVFHVEQYLRGHDPVECKRGIDAMRIHTHRHVAAEWDDMVSSAFRERSTGQALGVLRTLLHEDDHVAARVLASGLDDPEAEEALDLCERVIAGKDHSAEQYGEAAIDPRYEMAQSPRVAKVAEMFTRCTRVLDVACGNGSFALAIAQANPECEVVGLDFSEANIKTASLCAEELGLAERVTFHNMTVYDFDRQALSAEWETFVDEDFDGLFVGEFIEHLAETAHVVDGLETVLRDGATVIYTCPHGACVELLPRRMPLYRGHVHRFHYDDLYQVWGGKKDLTVQYLEGGNTIRGVPIGNWIIRYTAEAGRQARPRDLLKRIQRTRPLPMLSVGLIAKNAEANIVRCLESVWGLADEIIVGLDRSTTDGTRALVEGFGRTVRLVDVDPVSEQPEGFAGARNAVLEEARGEWFLWIDTDEVLMAPFALRRYLEGTVFNGYVLQQTHLYLDGPPTHDIPVRVFRRRPSVRFYGCVHEQPQDGDSNTNIHPTLELYDVKIAHFGYLDEPMREGKRVTRNLPLLARDTTTFADRRLGKVLLIREAVLQGQQDRAKGDTDAARRNFAYAVKLYTEHFDTPGDHLDGLSRSWYETALKELGLGWEHEIALAGRQGGLEGRTARPDKVWVRDADEYRRILDYKISAICDGMQPTTFITDPDELIEAIEAIEEPKAVSV